ncbi:MAG: glycosyltransferase [Chitinophagaceae bacterium]
MKKILIFHPYLAPYRMDLYNRLAEKYNVFVLLTASDTEKATLGFDLNQTNSMARFAYKYAIKGIYIGRHLFSMVYFNCIRSFKPDIVFAHELGFNTIISIFLKLFFRYKIFVTVDDSPAMIKTYGFKRRLLQRFVYRNVDFVLVVHPEVKKYLQNKYAKFLNKFIYFPIIQDDRILSEKLANANSLVRLDTKRYVTVYSNIILFVGRLETVKNPLLLLESFARLNDPSLLLVFVGGGSLLLQLKELAKTLKVESNVLFTGRLSGSDLYMWYNLSDIFVLPSKFEPFGAVVNEALVAGCNVLVSDQVGASCLIDSSNGIVFPLSNEDHLFLQLKEMLRLSKAEKKNKMIISFDDLFNLLVEYL